jgi:hypothetical protein
MKVSEAKLKIRHKDQNKVVISQVINQSEVDLIGGIWTDQEGKIHYVGLIKTKHNDIMPDFPKMKDVYIADVAQVGLKR